MTMQPSEYDIQREVEALRDIKRRSTTPGAQSIDPDLPSPTSPTAAYWSAGSNPGLTDGESSSSSHEDGSSSERSLPNNPADDPFHLFWVPASLHPEIAPAEFRAFLKEHARSPPPADGTAPLERSNSVASIASSLGRKKSMLSRQYRPSDHEGTDEDERIVPLRRNRTSVYNNVGPHLTINDLQKLEELAEEASESDDPSKLRNLLRRSLSLNLSPSAIAQMDDMPEMGDEADAPIIVPPPGQILRRAARTKIRKPSLPGDGGGHRFGASRRGAGARPVGAAPASTPGAMEPRTSSDVSSSDHGESTESPTDSGLLRQRTFSNESMENPRPDSFSEEASIYDAYARDEDEDIPPPVLITSPPPTTVDLPVSPPPPEAPPLVLEEPEPVLHQPQPQRLVVPQTPSEPQGVPRTTPSPEPSPTPSGESPSATTSPSSARTVTSPSPSPSSSSRHTKDKKGLFGKWGGDKGGKKNGKEKEKERERERVEKEKEKESGFFGSLFGGSKKKQDEHPPPLITGGSAGREAAQALLGASKSSKAYNPPPSPLSSGLGNSYARYPIHVERAIYRLSHIKLANPRRPLYEQVLISNLMFWYLGVINKAQNPPEPPAEGQAPSSTGTEAAGGGQTNSSGAEVDQEQRERESREKAEKERLEREQQEREREMETQKKKESRRGPLTKPASTGTSGSGRRAEMPVKGPQYEMQHRVMEQEYDGYNNNNGQRSQGPPRTSSAQSAGGQSRQQSSSQAPKLVVQPQPQLQLSDSFYYNGGEFMQNNQPQLPPGAMPPTDQSAWLSQSSSSPRKHSSPSPPPMSPGAGAPHRRSRSPPPVHKHGQQSVNRYSPNSVPENHHHGGSRQPSRSLSATAVPSHPPPPVNGKVRKGVSAHAVVAQSQGSRKRTSEGQNGEEEDLPLAIWQQQRRK